MPRKPPEHPQNLLCDQLGTPIGTALLVGMLRALDWDGHENRMLRLLRLQYGENAILSASPAPAALRRALDGYFAGDLKQIEAIACRTAGTSFQRKVWAALRKIPAGKTMTYGALAAQLGSPAAMRAVGAANGANPISVVVPCHRLIGANGTLIKYGGGLERKRWLLAHEGVEIAPRHTAAA
jgi:methylated-DNA-[protein]-cysteine S-methyltransferase